MKPLVYLTRSCVESLAFLGKRSPSYSSASPGIVEWSDVPCLVVGPGRIGRLDYSKKTVVYFHGNMESAGSTLGLARTLVQKFDVNVVVPEYLGYGYYRGNANHVSPCRTIADWAACDGMTVLAHLTQHIPFDRIYLIGSSLGSGVAARIAQLHQEPFGGVILLSPYLSLISVFSWTLARLFPFADSLKTYENLKNVENVSLIHGNRDEVIPYSHSIRLKEMHNVAFYTVVESDHNGLLVRHQEEVFAILKDIFDGIE